MTIVDDALHPVTGLPGRPPLLGPRALLACTRQVWLDHDRCCADHSEKATMSAAQEVGGQRSVAAQDDVLAALRAAHGDRLLVVEAPTWPERVVATLDALAAGLPLVWRPALPVDEEGGRRGAPHLLVRHARRADGRWAYLPVDVRHHKALTGSESARPWRTADLASPWLDGAADSTLGTGRPREDDDLRLAHAHRVLAATGHGSDDGSAWAAIVDRDGRLVWRDLAEVRGAGTGGSSAGRSRLDAYDEAFAERLRVAHAASRHVPGDPALVPLCRSYGSCRTSSPWRVREREELEAADSVVLLSRMSQEKADTLEALGIGTRSRLAALTDAEVADLAAQGFDWVAPHVLSARAWTCGGVVARPGWRGVDRADVEVDVDMENSADGTVYLWGLEVSSRTDPDLDGVLSAWADGPDDEAAAFVRFWSRLEAVREAARERGRSLRVYCYYAPAEAKALRDLVTRHAGTAGVPTREAVEALLGGEQWCDLYTTATRLAWPCDGLSIKSVATVIGFSWHDEEPSGGGSLLWRRDYEAALAAGDGPAAQGHRSRLVQYNADDLRVMRALRDWLEANGPLVP